jgi:xanthine dehydrogenase accessory factor
MFNKFLDVSSDLYESNEPFAVAYVVKKAGLTSGKPGDKAVIKRDGTLIGWIGGGCSKGIIIKEGLEAIKDGKPRMIAIQPDAAMGETKGVKMYSMSCHSGGAVDVFIEPVLPKPQIVIIGQSHTAYYLSKLAEAMEFRVSCVVTNNNTGMFDHIKNTYTDFGKLKSEGAYVVVCTQGEGDEQALLSALNLDFNYLSFVASRRKSNAIFKALRGFGVTFDQLKKIKTPAGLDINAKLPEEVAVSILAEIIQTYRSESEEEKSSGQVQLNDDVYVNPVCGIPVSKSTAKHVLEHEGEKVYFCCDGCKVSFEKEPDKYITVSQS